MFAVMLGRATAFSESSWPWNSGRGSVVVGLQAQLHTFIFEGETKSENYSSRCESDKVV